MPAFLGLAQPAMSRLTGHYTHVTLHHLMDNIDLADSGVRFPRTLSRRGFAATRMLLMANSISVLLPVYRRTLIEKYRGENVHFRAHGILGGRPEPPDFSPARQSRAPHSRLRKMGHLQAAGVVDRSLRAFGESRCPMCAWSSPAAIIPRRPAMSNRGGQSERQSACRIYRVCCGRGHSQALSTASVWCCRILPPLEPAA